MSDLDSARDLVAAILATVGGRRGDDDHESAQDPWPTHRERDRYPRLPVPSFEGDAMSETYDDLYIRPLLVPGPATDALDEELRDVACRAYALGQRDVRSESGETP